MRHSPICIRAAAAGALIITAAFIPVRTQALEDYTSPRNATVDARGARSATIDAEAGILRVEGRAGLNEVRIRGTARSSRESYLKDIKLIAERRGDVVFIKVEIPDNDDRGGWNDNHYRALDLIIEVPTTLKLDVNDGSGEAEFRNTGAIDLEDGSGSIEIRDAHGDVRVRDGSGSIFIDGVEGALRVSDGSGNIDVDRVAGDFVVDNDGSGSIRYATVKGSVRIPDRGRRNRH